MRTSVAALSVVVLCTVGCQKNEPRSSAKPRTGVKPRSSDESQSSARPSKAAATKEAAAAMKPSAGQAKAAAEPEPTVYTPLKTQLGNKAAEIVFLGWLGRGERFVTRSWRPLFVPGTSHAETLGEVRLIEVHETISGLAVASFRRGYVHTSNNEDGWQRAHEEAKPGKAWSVFLAANAVAKAAPSRVAPGGAWSLVARPARRFAGFSVSADRRGASYHWSLHEGGKGRPSVNLSLQRGSDTREFKVLRFQVPIAGDEDDEEEVESAATTISGKVRAYWSADGERVLLLLSAENDCKETPKKDARFYVRSLGPQVQLNGSAKDAMAAHKAARRLGQVELPVARLTLDHKARPETLIYYRGEHKAQAEAAARAIGRPYKIKQLKSRGWVHIIVLLASKRQDPKGR